MTVKAITASSYFFIPTCTDKRKGNILHFEVSQ
jgi:hypothetical protein